MPLVDDWGAAWFQNILRAVVGIWFFLVLFGSKQIQSHDLMKLLPPAGAAGGQSKRAYHLLARTSFPETQYRMCLIN